MTEYHVLLHIDWAATVDIENTEPIILRQTSDQVDAHTVARQVTESMEQGRPYFQAGSLMIPWSAIVTAKLEIKALEADEGEPDDGKDTADDS
jgi:hypothetical protein